MCPCKECIFCCFGVEWSIDVSFPSPLLLLYTLLFSHSVVSTSLRPCGLQHSKLPCPSPTPGAYSNSCPLCRLCHPTISSSVPFSSCLQSFPALGSFPMSWFFTSGGQSNGVSASASVLPMIKSYPNNNCISCIAGRFFTI